MNLRERIEFVIKIVEEFGKLDDELLQLAHKNNSWFEKKVSFVQLESLEKYLKLWFFK